MATTVDLILPLLQEPQAQKPQDGPQEKVVAVTQEGRRPPTLQEGGPHLMTTRKLKVSYYF